MAEVFHRIYTHAPRDEYDTTGGRAVPLEDRDVASVLPELVGELDELLRKTKPEGHVPAWIVRRFIAGGSSWGCVIASYPDLIKDAGGRDGVLNHARLVRVGANEASFDVAALVAAANDFGFDDIYKSEPQARLSAYLDQVSGEQSLSVGPVSIEELRELSRDFLRDFLIACLAGIGDRKAMRCLVSAPSGEWIPSLATAWAALPIGLQQSSSFASGVGDGCPVDAILSTTSGGSPGTDALASCVDRYLQLLLDTPYDALSLLCNREITSRAKLDEAVKRAAPLAVLAEVPHAGRTEMKKGKKQERGRGGDGWTPAHNEAASELDRQYRAMEESLRAYVDMRLGQLQSGQPLPAPQMAGGRGPSSTRDAWMPWAAVGVVVLFAIALVVFVMNFRPERSSRNDPQTETRAEETIAPVYQETGVQAVSANRKILQDAIARASTRGDWAEELKTLFTNHPALSAAAVRAAANVDMSDSSRDVLERSARRIETGPDLGSDGRELLRAWLLDAIAASIAGPQQVRVDGKLTDLKPELLDRIRDRLHVSTAPNAGSINFQGEVILRWMEDREP